MSIGHERFIFGDTPNFFSPFDVAEVQVQKADAFYTTLLAFRNNLASAFQVASIPYQLVHVAVVDQRLRQLYSSESIRSLKVLNPGEYPSEEARKKCS